ncbi:glycoside hydrolase superfamily [Zychaea mexicana]|uniref:glycoside hydrolase superfamily n=1 Tax=Zychaea mexicana TaxID=64656 RepID=UPI0022FE49B9|nr:glycoside hydrolase superfamily [Zychaea mexicana]KAI9491545.1 glycoside hydrolase superfamily [Zychaea mexicana]
MALITRYALLLLTAASCALHTLGLPTTDAASDNTLTWDDAYTKARSIVHRMSLEQKVGLATGMGWEKTLCVGNTYASTNPNFPSLCLQDSPLGIRFADNVTAGVSGITAAASFDKVAIRQRGEYMASEFKAKGVHFQLGPSVDIMRAPQSGRAWEGFGEDPWLSGVAGRETITGIQSQGVIATVKHYIGNSQETHRTTSSSNIDKRTLHEVWTWPYARAVEAGVGAIMCSYNLVDDTYACENDYILNTVLKNEMGFRGLVMSDWGATHSTVESANAGLDMTMPGDILMGDGFTYFGANLTKAVQDGQVSDDRVTDMALRITAAYYKMRQDEGYPDTTLNTFNRSEAPEVLVQGDHATFVREIGAAGVVLLRNQDNILPLKTSDLKKIALIGSHAGPIPQGLNGCPDQSCGRGHLAMGWGSGTADFPYLITPTDGITARAGGNLKLVHTYDDYDLDGARELAADADIAIVFAMADAGEEYIVVNGNNDRQNLSLWNNGDNLIQAVSEVNDNVIVVINAVGPVLMPWIDHENIKAVVWPGLAGQESGNSLADVLFGDVNPSGRLPYTIARNKDDYGAHISSDAELDYSEKLLVGYKWFDAKGIDPLFEFGYGLSYTNFEYSGLSARVTRKQGAGAQVIASITLSNTGDRDGAEIPQAYIAFPKSAGEPPKLLRGFQKVFLQAGEQKAIDFEFTEKELSVWDEESEMWKHSEGEFTVHIGASSRDIRASASFII